MPESVKISELPVMTTPQADDVVPIVDSSFQTTFRTKVSEIAKLGGGAPGDGTVTTAKLADGSVTAAKCQFTGPNFIFTKTTPGAGGGVQTPLSPWARDLIAIADDASARNYIGIGPFNSARMRQQTKFDRGTPAQPSIIGWDDLDAENDESTGIYFGTPDAVSISINGQETFRFAADGSIISRTPGATAGSASVFLPRVGVVAWASFIGTSGATNPIVIAQNSNAITSRYGLLLPNVANAILGVGGTGTNPLSGKTWVTHATETRARLGVLENGWGFTATFPTSGNMTSLPANPGSNGWFQSSRNRINSMVGANWWPNFARGTETRENFSFPNSGTKLWYYDAAMSGGSPANWFQTTAAGHGWIGTMELAPGGATQSVPLSAALNIAGITRTTGQGTGDFQVRFERELPDANYAVIGICNDQQNNAFTAAPFTTRVTDRTTTGFRLRTLSTGTLTHMAEISFAVWR